MPRGQGGTLSGFKPLSTPNAPTDLSVDAGIGSAIVSFLAPSDTGDAEITSYVVTAVDESTGAGTGATGAASPITVTPPASGTFKIRAQAVNAFGPGRVTEFSTGNDIYSGAELYSWGRGCDGSSGRNIVFAPASSPIQVGALTNWAHVSAGFSRGVAIKLDGTIWSWGWNCKTSAYGSLGQNDTVSRSSPVQIGALTDWLCTAQGEDHVLAIKTNGTLWGWGRGVRVGDSTNTPRSSPVQVGALTTWCKVSGGKQHSAAVKTDCTLWTWGYISYGRLGNGATGGFINSPVQVGALTNWCDISLGQYHSIAIKTDNTMWGWGRNNFGQVGDGSFTCRSSPVQIGTSQNWVYASASTCHTLAVQKNGTLWAWGSPSDGRLGNNSTSASSLIPIQIGALTNWFRVYTKGAPLSLATKKDGTLWAWGNNSFGQLGDNTMIPRSSPVQIGSLANWVSVKTGYYNTFGLSGVL